MTPGEDSKRNILVVDDEPAVRSMVQLILARAGFEVFEAECGLKALDAIVKNQIEELDLLLTDVQMPNMDGITLAERCMRYYPRVKIVFMSGYPSLAVPDHSPVRTCHLIFKPFRPEILVTTLLRAMATE